MLWKKEKESRERVMRCSGSLRAGASCSIMQRMVRIGLFEMVKDWREAEKLARQTPREEPFRQRDYLGQRPPGRAAQVQEG